MNFITSSCLKRVIDKWSGEIKEDSLNKKLSNLILTIFITLFIPITGNLYAQVDCVHQRESFATSDPSCPGSAMYDIAKIDRAVTGSEIFYVKVSGSACCGNFLVNPKSGTECFYDTNIAGPAGPDVVITEVGTVPDTCDINELIKCSEGFNDVIEFTCSDGSTVGHRVTFLGSIEDGTDSYWYYRVENKVNDCISGISHIAFGVVDTDVCCVDPDLQVKDLAVCENGNTGSQTVDLSDALVDDGDGVVTYHSSEQDANNDVNPISATQEVPLTGDEFWIRSEDSEDANCFTVKKINVTVYDNPIVADKSVCVGSTVDFGPSGTYVSDDTDVATINNDGVATGVSAGTATITYTDANGCSGTATITVNANPIVADKSVCIGSTVDFGPSGTYVSDDTDVATVNNDGVATGVSAGTATITYTDANGCSGTATITVNANPIVADKSVCIGSTVDFGPSGTYVSDDTDVATINNDGVATGVSAGTATITYTDANGCSGTATITVNANPIVADKSVCVGSTVDFGPSGTYVSDDTDVATINNDGVATGVSAGTATITYTDANGCSGTATITVNANPIVADKSVCIGSTVDFGPSGTYVSDDTDVATINNDGVATGVSAGTATITYTDANGCSGTATITVNANPIVADKSVCIGSTVDFGPSGTYVSDDTDVATVNNDGVATGVSAGTATITYTDANGCSGTATITVNDIVTVPDKSVCIGSTVDFGPSGTYVSDDTDVATINNDGVATGVSAGTATITYTDANGCSGTATITVNANPIVADKSVCVGSTVDFGPSGTYVSDDTDVATINNDGVATGVSAGTATITYTDANGCSGTATITVNANPIVADKSVCIGSTVDFGPSGTYVSDDTDVATVNNDGVATGVSAGTATITYTDANGCSGTATITVNDIVTVPDKSVCIGSTVDFGPSGTYVSDDTDVATINNDGVATGVSAGTATITYTDANGCSGTATITVNANPIVADKSVCVGSTVDFGPSGTYVSDDTDVATINNDGVATGVSAGTATITYTDANGCSGTATITVNANPIVADKSVCIGSTVDFGPSGTYVSDDTDVATVNNDGVATGVSAGTATITYTDANGCSGTATITVNDMVTVPDKSVCVGSTVDFGPSGTYVSDDTDVATINNDGVATGVSAGTATITYTDANGCSGTATITVNANPIVADKSVCVGSTVDFGSSGTYVSDDTDVATINNDGVATGVSAGTATITYTDANGCSGTATITVNANPIVADKSVCIGSTVDFGPSGTYVSDDTDVATVNNDGVATGVSAGTATITYTDANGCSGTATITVNDIVTVPDKSVCIGSTVDFGPSGTYASDDTDVATINNDGVATGVSAGTATITYTDANGCSGTATITVNDIVTVPDKSVCVGSTVDFGSSGTYVSDDTDVATINNDGVATGVSAGTATITYTDANGCSGTATITVNANPIVADKSVCIGSTVDFGPSGTYVSDDTDVATVNNDGVATGVSAGTATITYTDANGCSGTVTITVNDIVTVPDKSVCIGSTVDFGPSGTYVSDDTDVATINNDGVATGVSAGTATITYTDANGCSGTATITVNANPQIPEYQITQADCLGGNGSLVFENAGENLYYSIDNGEFILYTGEIPLAVGEHTFIVKYGLNGCPSEEFIINIGRPQEVTVTLLPEVEQPECESLVGTIFILNEEILNYTVENTATNMIYYNNVAYPNSGFINLPPGEYLITGESINGCISGSVLVNLTEPNCVVAEGCTLGYWKNHTDRWCDEYQTCTLYGDVFENAPAKLADLTLLEVLNLGGGGVYNLGRQSVAALLNACSDEVNYDLDLDTTAEVIAYVIANFNNAGAAGSYLDELNNAGCPLGGTQATSAPSEECDPDDSDTGNNGKPGKGNNKASVSGFSAYPVPFKETLNIQYEFDYVSPATIQFFDMRGRLLRSVKELKATRGVVTTIDIDYTMKASQTYIVKVTTDREVITKQIISSK